MVKQSNDLYNCCISYYMCLCVSLCVSFYLSVCVLAITQQKMTRQEDQKHIFGLIGYNYKYNDNIFIDKANFDELATIYLIRQNFPLPKNS